MSALVMARSGEASFSGALPLVDAAPMKIVVLGAGNLLMMDEGVGVHAVAKLLAEYEFPQEVQVLDGGTASMEMLEDLENLDLLIVVDAVYAHQAVAETIKLENDEVRAFFRRKLSPHQIGLADVLASLEFIGRAPENLVVIGVKPVELELGMELTPRIAEKLPVLVQMVVETLTDVGYPPRRKVVIPSPPAPLPQAGEGPVVSRWRDRA